MGKWVTEEEEARMDEPWGILKESHSEAVGKSVSQQSSQLLSQSANFSLIFQDIDSELVFLSAEILELNVVTFLIGILIDSLTKNKI